MSRKKFNVLAQHLQEIMEESLPKMVDDRVNELTKTHVPVYVAQGLIRSGYQQKDRKQSQNDKIEHGMEKTVQNQGQSPKMPKSESILMNQQSNRSRN
ncbi:hypothetical protein Tco_1235256 [Tanacetum coccineum]